jgi:hemerythrin-like domain-containing protein
MDKLTRMASEHRVVSEAVTFYEQSLRMLYSHTEDFKQFLNEYIVAHFKFEEEDIFPLILEKGAQPEKTFIEELEREHSHLLDMVDQFNNLISKYGVEPTGEPYNEVVDLSRRIIETTISHASREDLELLPILKKYDIDLKQM